MLTQTEVVQKSRLTNSAMERELFVATGSAEPLITTWYLEQVRLLGVPLQSV
jgi:hypothetical protein